MRHYQRIRISHFSENLLICDIGTAKWLPDTREQPGHPNRVISQEFRVQMSILSLWSTFARSSYVTLRRRKVFHCMASKSNTQMRVLLGISMGISRTDFINVARRLVWLTSYKIRDNCSIGVFIPQDTSISGINESFSQVNIPITFK